MKELLIEALKFWDYQPKEVGDDILSFTKDRMAGDTLVAILDDEDRKIRFYNPKIYEVSRQDAEKLMEMFSSLNQVNRYGHSRAYCIPTDKDSFVGFVEEDLPYSDDKMLLIDEIHGIICHLLFAHKVIDKEYAERFDKLYWGDDDENDTEEAEEEDEPEDTSNDSSYPTIEEIEAEDNRNKQKIICDTLKEMQCNPDLSQIEDYILHFEYQGKFYDIHYGDEMESVVLISECVDSFDVQDTQKLSLVKKITNFLNSEHDVALVYAIDEYDKNLYNVFPIASLRCKEKEYFKENLLNLINDYIFVNTLYNIILGELTGSKEIKEEKMLNYDL